VAGNDNRLGKNRGNPTIVHLSCETGAAASDYADELFWRKPELKGKDKPKETTVNA